MVKSIVGQSSVILRARQLFRAAIGLRPLEDVEVDEFIVDMSASTFCRTHMVIERVGLEDQEMWLA